MDIQFGEISGVTVGQCFPDRKALREAGVQVEAKCFEGLIHGFSGLGAEIDVARKARDEIFQVLKKALS